MTLIAGRICGRQVRVVDATHRERRDRLDACALPDALHSDQVAGTSEGEDETLANRIGPAIDLVAASDTRVLVNVSRDESGIVESVEGFVAAFNDVVDRINTYDSYDSETEQRGPLLGDPTVSRVKTELYRTLQQSAVGVDTTYRYLSQVGIRVTTDGKIELDKSKFNAAYELSLIHISEPTRPY